MEKVIRGPEPGSLDWHIENYRGPIYRLKVDGPDPVPDLFLTRHNTRIHRFDDSELDHLRIEDLARESLVWLFPVQTIGAAILDNLESQGFSVLRQPLPDETSEEMFVQQRFTMPPGDIDSFSYLSRPGRR